MGTPRAKRTWAFYVCGMCVRGYFCFCCATSYGLGLRNGGDDPWSTHMSITSLLAQAVGLDCGVSGRGVRPSSSLARSSRVFFPLSLCTYLRICSATCSLHDSWQLFSLELLRLAICSVSDERATKHLQSAYSELRYLRTRWARQL
jgi:hypothetical protein